MKKEICQRAWPTGLFASLFVAGLIGWYVGQQPCSDGYLNDLTASEVAKKQAEKPPEPKIALPDFASMSGKQRKSSFFNYIGLAIETENQRISALNQSIAALSDKSPLTATEQDFLTRLAKKYRLKSPKKGQLTPQAIIDGLLVKVQPVPKSLAQAQAANESAWGTSRFASLGNNYFGQWCFSRGCGLVPESRTEGAKHEVAKFSSPQESVASYILNLNRHAGYRDLRKVRQCVKERGQTANGWTLAGGLVSYSSKGFEYIDILRGMIRFNRLEARKITEAETNCLALYAPKRPEKKPEPEALPESAPEVLTEASQQMVEQTGDQSSQQQVDQTPKIPAEAGIEGLSGNQGLTKAAETTDHLAIPKADDSKVVVEGMVADKSIAIELEPQDQQTLEAAQSEMPVQLEQEAELSETELKLELIEGESEPSPAS
ncbi:glucosaminidase domain-containing protein [Pelagibaculum spongiae]|uniref:Mannosyl-glycoprotein endo-beta-N-acetylglucosamidase-like domain-containing protein n=1 Tax=Pelagibaculum spongiae TaxID=2080658 RepID=A0A2V1GVP6_9GAMM|nr:glucosaminidase domain-containing protein [Pelagibaculum spongiae]PVZ69023.1 hypothetical protein DC094_12380 [Pelagibaculum spongiae]